MMTEGSRAARIKCREIMTSSVKTATRDMSLRDVATLMRDGDMGSIPVVEDGKLVGIVTDRDIVVRSVADGKDATTPVSEAMTTEIFSVKPDDFVFEAIRLMGDKQVRRVFRSSMITVPLPVSSRWLTSHSRRKTNARSPKRSKRSQPAALFGVRISGSDE